MKLRATLLLASLLLFPGCIEVSFKKACVRAGEATRAIAQLATGSSCASLQCDIRIFSPEVETAQVTEEWDNNVRANIFYFNTEDAIANDGPLPDYNRSEVLCYTDQLRVEKSGSVSGRASLITETINALRAQCSQGS